MITNAAPCITSIESLPFATSIGEGSLLTGPKVATAYNIPESAGANVKIGIISLGGGYSQADLNKSLANLSLTAPTITFVGVSGATNTYTGNVSTADGENALDLVCASSLVPQANIVLYKAKTINDNGTLYLTDYANVFQRAVDENCDVITMSWGGAEFGNDFLSAPLANAASKGITVFISSGDYGSTADGTTVSVLYPSTNSNVISVGGTNLSVFSGNSIRSNETAYNNSESGLPFGFGGSGGISSFIPVPSWQTGLTYRKYFTANSSYGPITTINGRGTPDIAAAMNAYGVWVGNAVYSFSGTSASAPIMAGMFARYVSLTGRRPIPNAIHPVLYGNLNAYYDIQTGNNASKINTGYAASSNWDPVTGVGVPYGNVVYQMVSSGGTTVKTADNSWNYVANIKVKTDATTWANVKSVWTKVNSTTWKQSF